ncbi:hypothetical protein [Mycoplasmopsis pullorum]|uniref:hypothetical protein n=2 Tax=Mycoplasmopsis pullorum TaxID=48003 RepID=UPI00111B08BC|nr:hypothetical protein [Mycoplasmopsis pullorum]TNK83119.1 hypothetical protein C4M93_02885 [Mycoplasmopsis pullorum]
MSSDIKEIVFLDIKTNGYDVGETVLSISAIKFEINKKTGIFKKIGDFTRYYSYKNNEPEKFLDFHGLSKAKLSQKRKESLRNAQEPYSDDFNSDFIELFNFCGQNEYFVGLNIKRWGEFIQFPLAKQYDLMYEGINVTKLEGNWKGHKYPQLYDCVKFFDLAYTWDDISDSYLSALATAEIFMNFLKLKVVSALDFLES